MVNITDLLTRDYNTDQKFSISTNSVSGVVSSNSNSEAHNANPLTDTCSLQALTSTVVKKGVVHAADVSTQYKYRNSLFDLKIDTDSSVQRSPL